MVVWCQKRVLLKEFDLTEEDFNEIRSTYEYKERVFNLMFENRSAEEFEAWSSRHSDNMYQRLGEIVGLDPEIVSDLVEQVRQAHADRAAGRNMETQTPFTVPQILAMRQWFKKKKNRKLRIISGPKRSRCA